MAHRRRQNRGRSLPSITTIVTAASAAYGTYRLASWALKTWRGEDDEEGVEIQNCDGDGLLHQADSPPSPRCRSSSSLLVHKRRIRQSRIDKCHHETVTALADFLPTLRRSVEDLTDTSAAIRELKSVRAEMRRREAELSHDNGAIRSASQIGREKEDRERERELWEIIKLRSVTRTVATAYGHAILLLTLTVQVHVLGGRLLREEEEAKVPRGVPFGGSDASDSTAGTTLMEGEEGTSAQAIRRSHQAALTRTYSHFFDTGVKSLVETVERASETVMEEWDVTDESAMNMTGDQFDEVLCNIRSEVEGGLSNGIRDCDDGARQPRSSRKKRRCLVRFVIQKDDAVREDVQDELARNILEETWDLLESPTFEAAERDIVDLTFDMMRNGCWGSIFVGVSYSGEVFQKKSCKQSWESKPLASVITQLRHVSNSFYGGSATIGLEVPNPHHVNIYVPELVRTPSLVELGDVSFD